MSSTRSFASSAGPALRFARRRSRLSLNTPAGKKKEFSRKSGAGRTEMRITINGRQLEVEGKKTILEVARASRIFIPSLCDHPELAPFGGCRLCLVEIKGRRGYPPACSTFAEEGLEVVTETPELQAMRRQVLELILSEHPHACLICAEKKNCDDYKSTIRKVGEVTGCVLCPNNGRCQLQEVVEALKIDRVSFPALYRNFDVRRQDPFFDRNYNLCILCGRCVRVCHEVRGASAVSFVFRGSQAVVGTAFDRPLLESGCQFCGACVDVCPTGALTERATRGELLPAEERRTVCPLCSLGCELVVSLRDGRIVSSVAGDGESPNRGQVCVKGRFLVRDVVYSAKRILKPLIRREGKLEEANWEEALDFVAGKLQEFRGKDIALVGSTQVSIEDIHVLDKFARDVLATENIAFGPVFSPVAAFWRNLRENGLEPELNFEMSSLARADVILVAGADLGVSHPILWLEVFRSLRNGGKLVLIQDRETSLERHASFRLAAERGSEFAVFDRLSMRLLEKNPENPASLAGGYEEWREFLAKENRTLRAAPEGDEAGLEAVARLLNQSRETVFLLGPSLTSSPASRGNLRAFWNLAQLSAARILPLATEINERGALELRMRFRGPALFLDEILSRARAGAFRSLYLAGPLPGLPETAVDFLVIQDSYMNENVDRADAVLPATTF
ncbi:MAG: 4Fe-4S dicluster domain-containing protein, partial [Candidatus Aminicenantes bacterium]|nr:4Fe-4S dicluster domain-containing protein [Candidatus Aminicenantes bacterium]